MDTMTFMSFHVSEGGLEQLLHGARRGHIRSCIVATGSLTIP